jgi:ribosomal protein L11 methylase PrmA
VDTDADAIACARENAARNACADRVSFRLADLRELGDTAGVVVANLTGGLVVSAAAALAARAEARSTIVISGFLRHESHAVIAAFGDRIRVVERATEGEWEAAVLARSGTDAEG